MTRPMSDRHHDPADADHPFEVRLAEPATDAAVPWRTVAYTVEYDDAALVAGALVAAAEGAAYAEVWGPDEDRASHRSVRGRFPVPTREEQQQMWLEAANEHFSSGYSDLKH